MSDSKDAKNAGPARVSRRDALKKIAAAAALPVAASTVTAGCILYSDYSDYFNYCDYYYCVYTNYYVVYTNYYY